MSRTDQIVGTDRRPLDAAEIRAVVLAVAAVARLDGRDAQLLKFTNNAVVRLPRAGVVLRIAGSAVIGARVLRVTCAARRFERQGIPAVRLWPGSDQPRVVRGHEVTMWEDVRPVRAARAPDLARLLRMLHRSDRSDPEGRADPQGRADPLPDWDPVAGVRGRIGAAGEGVPLEVLDFLSQECDTVADELSTLDRVEPLLPAGLMHGDAFLGNVIVGAAGPVLCDFDSTGQGPREWDLTPVAAGARRFEGGAVRQREMAQAYGVDVTGWPGFGVLRRLRELQLVTSVLPVLAANPALRAQWRVRVESLRRGDEEARWTPYEFASTVGGAQCGRRSSSSS